MASFQVVSLDEQPEPGWTPDAVSASRNAIGRPAERILFLWPFARPINLRAQVIGHGWAQIGPVHLLLRPGWGVMRNVLSSMEEARAALEGLPSAPGRHKAPQLRFGDGIWRPYFGYPVQPLTVDGRIWQQVFAALVERCGLCVVDLTAKRDAQGLSFELSFLFGRAHPSRLALLVDSAQADVDHCLRLIEATWDGAGPRAASSRGAAPPILLYDSQSPAYVRAGFRGAFTGKATLPIAAKALRCLGWV